MTLHPLHVGTSDGGHREFRLPLASVTQTFAILAKRGVGKTYTASVIAEEMLEAKQPIIAIDPTGAWWGLRSHYPVVVLGGEKGDVPLEPGAGEVIARAVVENRFPAVLDLSLFRKGDMIRFMVAFAETLYRLNREAVHLFVDEADAVAPQAKNYGGDENRMLGAMEDIVRRGRKRGIGCTLITQRPAVLNKNVLTQCEVLVAMRLVHPKDIDAIEEWVNVHSDPAQAKEMIMSLPGLPAGTAWFWSPGFGDIFRRVEVRQRRTHDSGATPKPGEAEKSPTSWAQVNIAALGEQIRATVEKAKADDPAELRREIVRLKQQLNARPQIDVDAMGLAIAERDKEWRTLWENVTSRFQAIHRQMEPLLALMHPDVAPAGPKEVTSVREVLAAYHAPKTTPTYAPVARVDRPSPPPPSLSRLASVVVNNRISGRQQSFLDAAATLQTLKVQVDRETVAGWLGLHPRGGSVGEELGALAKAGYITMDRGEIRVTDAGMKAATFVDPGKAIDNARAGLTPRQRDFFDMIIKAHPAGMTREAIAAAKGLHPRGGSLGEDLGRLVGRGLIERDRGVYRAREFLFLHH